MAKKWTIPVEWEMCGKVRVEADTLEEAIQKANTDEAIELPGRNYYVDGSFRVSDISTDTIRQCYNRNQPDD